VRVIVRVALAAGVMLGAVGGLAARADAHASLESSVPESGAALDAAPDELVLDFNEPVDVALGGVTLVDAEGSAIEIGEAHLRDGTDDVVVADLPALDEGQYIAGFEVVSADGHPVSGDIVFRIGAGAVDLVAAPSADRSQPVDLLYGVARFSLYPALVGSMGLWLFALLVWPPMWTRARRAVLVSLGVCGVAAGLQFALAAPYLTGGTAGDAVSTAQWGDVADTSVGGWLLVRLLVTAVLLGGVALVPRRVTPRHPLAVGLFGVGFAVLAATVVGDGHGNAGRWFLVGFGSAWVHVVAMALWLGGLVAIVWGARAEEPWLLEAVSERWSTTAAVSVALIVASGVAQAWRLLPDFDALGSRYGWLLIAKTVLVVAMLVLGNRGRLLLRRRATPGSEAWPRGLHASVLVEVAVAVGVLVITTALVQTDPSGALAAAGASTTTVAATPWTAELVEGPTTMTVTLDGVTAGRHRMTISVDDAALPFADPAELTARLTLPTAGLGPIPVLFTETGRLEWESDAVEIPAAGVWQFEAFVADRTSKVRFSTPIDITSTGVTP
jgi:copper transport protein